MSGPRTRLPRTTALAALAAALVLVAGACSDDGESADTTTTASTTTESTETTAAGPSESEATVRYDEGIQAELIAVGCYKGAEDGIIGPETDAAIVAFQKAEGLEADGELGPETGEALKAASSEGRRVCGEETTTTKAPSTTAKASTTTAAGGGASAPCTATALKGGLPDEGESITSYVCAGGWAAGSVSGGSKFILQAQGGQWYAPSQDPCGSASAGLPPVILEDGCG